MESTSISPSENTIVIRVETPKSETVSSCCGGAPVSNGDACCKLDEDKKSAGDFGCGCYVPASTARRSSCC